MITDIALVFLYLKQNRYSFNALAGSLESDAYFTDLPIYFPTDAEELMSDLRGIISRHNKVIVALSFFTTQILEIRTLIKRLRQEYGNAILLLAGGPHPTGEPERTLRMGIDIVIRGEGEEVILELLKAIDENTNIDNIKGLSFFDENGNYNYTGRRTFIDLNHYPPFSPKYRKLGPIEITRGCPYVCYFCQTPQLFGVNPRHRSVEKICEYVSVMKSKNLNDIRFITPNAFSYGSSDGKTINLQTLESLLRSVREVIGNTGKIFIGSFPSEVRPEHVTEESIEVLKRYVNNDNLVIGGQSGSDRVLKLCHRGHTVEDIYKAVSLTIKAGFKANVDFIFGLPGEQREDVLATIAFMNELVSMGARIHTHTFMPLPQTAFSRMSGEPIAADLRALINKLVSTKVAYGNWIEQENIAKQIINYNKTHAKKRHIRGK